MSGGLDMPFEALEAGASFASRGRTVTEADVVGFANLTGDRHPVHTDAVWAAQTPFGERIAHGMLILSFAVGLIPLDPNRVAALRGVDDVRFKRPIRLGDTITVHGEITDVRALDPALGLVRSTLRVLDQEGRLAARGSLEMLWRREVVPMSHDTEAVNA